MNYKVVLLITFFVSIIETESKPVVDYIELILRKIRKDEVSQSKFSYNEQDPNGPSKWKGSCNTGSKQSPIVYDQVPAKSGAKGNNLRFLGAYNTKPKEVHVVNNGYGATFSFVYHDNSVPQITGGPLENHIYNFHSFHFHYPCEHLPKKFKVNCQLELHFVHFNSKYRSMEDAVDKPDGLAVLGIMYGTTSVISRDFPYTIMLQKVNQPNTEYTETENVFTYARAIGFTHIPKIVSYKGSLTTPGCAESVTWLVVDELRSISNLNLLKIRTIRDVDGNIMLRNNRPVQPLNGRSVFKYNEF